MSLKSSTKTATNTYELVIEVSGTDFDKAVNNVYNRQKKLRDKKLITERRSVKNFIRWAVVIKITAGILQEPPISSRLSAWQADLQCSADPPAYPL